MGDALAFEGIRELQGDPLVRLGPVSHIGIVVDSIDEAVSFYSETFGIGPWQIVDFDGTKTDYFLSYGEPAEPNFKAALYYSGKTFIELVEVTKGETVHTQFYGKKGEGLQHLCFLCENTDDVLQKLATRGIKPVLDYRFTASSDKGSNEIREVYLNTDEFVGGVTLQLLESTPV